MTIILDTNTFLKLFKITVILWLCQYNEEKILIDSLWLCQYNNEEIISIDVS